ncbi:MAG: M16 family metallopeptidase [Terriglobia bacterium]
MIIRHAFLVCLIILPALLTASAADKSKPLPKDLPPYCPLEPFKAPQVTARTLSNGFTLWLVPRPGFPKASFAVAVRGGLASDPMDRPGLSQLITDALDQGTKTRTAKQIAEELQAAGGDLSGAAGSDSIVVSTSVLSSNADAALTVLADVLQNATFPDSEVELAKRNAVESLRSQEADPSFLARRALAKAVFADHPYSVISGTQASIQGATAEDLRHEYAKRFRPDQAVLVAVGDFQPDKLMATIESLFVKWSVPKDPPLAALQKPSRPAPREVFYVERAGSVQTNILVGALGPTRDDPDYASTQVANAIYGGMFGSRLTLNIREDKGYTYSPWSALAPRRLAAILQTSAAVRNEVTGASLNEINYELNRMATTAAEPEEISQAQRYLTGTRALELQSQGTVASELARLWVFGLPPEELGAESARIQKVTAKDVAQVGAKYFPASRQTIVTVGEKKVIEEQLAPFGLKVEQAPKME